MSVAPEAAAGAERWLDGAAIDQSAVLFVIGLGDGQLLTALASRGWRGRVIALEPAGSSPLTPSADLTILTGPEYAGLDHAVMAIDPDREQPVVVGDPAVMRAHRDDAVRVSRLVVRAWFGARANQEARRKYAGPYLLNTLRNLAAIGASEDAAVLVDAFRGLPAVLVAAGPSLDATLPEIVAHRDKVVLIAVDTAVRPLLGAGVQPDVVVALDPSDANASHLVDLPPCPRTWLVGEGSLDPVAFDHFAGRTFVFRVADHHPWPWLRRVGLDRHALRAWGSVLTTAFDLALQMGCDPIVFTGADLAFSSGRPYARGTTFEEEWRRARAWGDGLETSWAQRLAAWPETFEPGVDGTGARTAPHLVAFRDWIAAAAARVPGRAVVNATGAGILAGPALRQATLTEALAGREPLALSVSELMRRRKAGGRQFEHGAIPAVPDDVRRDWQTWAGVTSEAIDDAFTAPPPVVASDPVGSPGAADATAEAAAEAGADDRFLQELAGSMSVRRLRVTSPDQDLLGELRALTRGLRATDAVVVVDEVGVGVGTQVRQAVEVLLCERPDLWLEYRRFVDHRSRLTILRGEASRHTPPAHEADTAKWDPDHAPIAAELVPMLVRALGPRSVIDLGCGAGYWLRAFEAAGVTDVLGVSARTTPLGTLPDPGRRFDLCLCLEVAQQLAPADQQALIGACTRASDVVVFSSRLPGAPGSSPHDRPLQYWAAAFWCHGYILDDTLRQIFERRSDIPRSVFEVMVTFRRARPAPSAASDAAAPALQDQALASAARLNDLYTQKIWWAVAALDLERAAQIETPRPEDQPWPIPASRLLTAPDGARVFRFRTSAARWYVTHPASTLRVLEDGRALPALGAGTRPHGPGGGWTRWRDEIRVWSSDGSDPRTNRHRYSVVVPGHVAWAESQSLGDVLRADL